MLSRFREIEGRISADTGLCVSLNRPIKRNTTYHVIATFSLCFVGGVGDDLQGEEEGPHEQVQMQRAKARFSRHTGWQLAIIAGKVTSGK